MIAKNIVSETLKEEKKRKEEILKEDKERNEDIFRGRLHWIFQIFFFSQSVLLTEQVGIVTSFGGNVFSTLSSFLLLGLSSQPPLQTILNGSHSSSTIYSEVGSKEPKFILNRVGRNISHNPSPLVFTEGSSTLPEVCTSTVTNVSYQSVDDNRDLYFLTSNELRRRRKNSEN